MSRILAAFFALLLVAVAVAVAAASGANADTPPEFRPANGDYRLSYPRDHGAHPDFETEWWYVTGHLNADDGATFGFELVFFRVGVKQSPEVRSDWRMDSFSFAHFALTDDQNQKFYQFKRRSRGSFGQAGASEEKLNVWLRDWKLSLDGDKMTLAAAENGVALRLALEPKKPLVLHGENGLSKKGPGPGDASYYSSFTRLAGTGELSAGGKTRKIAKASAWLDQEFTSSKLARGTEGWDWFAVQLENGEELMVYQLRTESGEPSEYSSGTWIRSDGSFVPLARKDFTIEKLRSWKSPETGVTYPSKWRVTVPSESFAATITPTVPDQEIITEGATGVTYWEGRSKVEAEKSGAKLGGNAYVELVGYK